MAMRFQIERSQCGFAVVDTFTQEEIDLYDDQEQAHDVAVKLNAIPPAQPVELLRRIVDAYDRLMETNGATCLLWSNDFEPRHWVGGALEGYVTDAKALLAQA